MAEVEEERSATAEITDAGQTLSKALRDYSSERRAHRSLLMEVSEPILWVSADCGEPAVIDDLNAAAVAVLGDRKGSPLHEIIPERWRDQHAAALLRVGEEERQTSYLSQWQTGLGCLTPQGERPCSLLVLELANGERRHYIGLLRVEDGR